MACKRCEDIHEAQKNGKTIEPCKCDCHNTNTWTTGGTSTIPFQYNATTTDPHIDFNSITSTIEAPFVWEFDKPKPKFKCDCIALIDEDYRILCGCARPCYCNVLHSNECIRNAYKLLNAKDSD